MDNLKFKDIFLVLDEYDAILFDLWGVVVEGNYVYPGVVDSINKIIQKKEVFFLSNSPRPREKTFDMIKSWGISTSIDNVFTSGEMAKQMVVKRASENNELIFHWQGDINDDHYNGMLGSLNEYLTSDINEASIFLMTGYLDEGEDLDQLDPLLKKAVELGTMNVCANPDTIIPRLGKKRYCPGYFAKKIEDFGGQVVYIGKPRPEIYEQIFQTIPNIQKNRILMIGDTFDTDILGANRTGIHSALVLTGNAAKFHEQHEEMHDKLKNLTDAANKLQMFPNFVTSLN